MLVVRFCGTSLCVFVAFYCAFLWRLIDGFGASAITRASHLALMPYVALMNDKYDSETLKNELSNILKIRKLRHFLEEILRSVFSFAIKKYYLQR